MADVLSLDFETFSEVDLRARGAHIYAAHSSTDITTMAWAMNNDAPRIWHPGLPFPAAIADHVVMGGRVHAWNAQFERLIWRHVLGPRYDVPVPTTRQYVCTMVRAYAMGLPGSLDKASRAVGLEARKDNAGKAAMLLTCKPQMVTVVGTPHKAMGRVLRSHPHYQNTYKVLDAYCVQDVIVERKMSQIMQHLIPFEQELWWLDQEIQDRGILLDMDLVLSAEVVADDAVKLLTKQFILATGASVRKVTDVSKLKRWLELQGVPPKSVESLDKDAVDKLLARKDLKPHVRRAIELRQEAGKSSIAKLTSFQAYCGDDGKIRGQLQWHGASTGRDAGRGVQVQNFARPELVFEKWPAAIKALKTKDAGWVQVLFGKPLTVVVDCLRNCLIAPPGDVMYSGDLSQIEARMTVTLAGQQHMIDAFAAYDAKTGPDIYIIAAAGVYVVDPSEIDKKDPRRQIGKVSTLALGFGGGAGAFAKMAANYLVDLEEMYATVWAGAEEHHQDAARKAYETRGKKTGLSPKAWIGSELVKLAWRDANPDIVQYWQDLEWAASHAIMYPGTEYEVRGIKFSMPPKIKGVLQCRLLSGRSLYYPFPSIVDRPTGWEDEDGEVVYRPGIRYMGMGKNNNWSEQFAYGGFFCQNIVQASARDVMFEALVRLEQLGYRNIMRVHDELVSLRADGQGSEAEFQSEMTRSPDWLPNLAVAADVWSGKRYKK